MISFPTPDNAAKIEHINNGFVKLHPGPPVHYFTRCDDDMFHTHKWNFLSHIVVGGYREEVLVPQPDGSWQVQTFDRLPGTSHVMPAGLPHKLIALLDGPCITRCEYTASFQEFGFCRFENGVLLHRFHNQPDWKPYTLDISVLEEEYQFFG